MPLGACGLTFSTDVEAKDQWARTYPLSAQGQVLLANSNGKIEVTGGDTDKVTITAERIVRAATEALANEQLAAFDMHEQVSPDRISIDASSRGLTINVSRKVNYVVTIPRTATLSLSSSNGDILVTNIGGHFSAEASNGRVRASGLQQSAKVSTTNGVIDLAFDNVSGEGIRAETTNGTITISVPTTTNADLSARVTNGGISHEGLDIRIAEESRRRLDGTLGTGGPQIRLETTNGAITVRGVKR
jgi:DUF4097 and DUF4098 domain-containing protein YvlB